MIIFYGNRFGGQNLCGSTHSCREVFAAVLCLLTGAGDWCGRSKYRSAKPATGLKPCLCIGCADFNDISETSLYLSLASGYNCTMGSKGKKSQTFDSLVAGLTEDERRDFLQKMGHGTVPGNSGIEAPEEFDEKETARNLKLQLGKQSLVYRLWVLVRSLVSGRTAEKTFNKDILDNMARVIERRSPGLIDYRRHVLCTTFYEKFSELKHVADFFKPYLERYAQARGSFYVILGNIVIPDMATDIKNRANPYSYSMDRTLNTEMRSSLLRNLDDILQKIPSDKKKAMYVAVRSVDWLCQFVRLPFEKVLSKFNIMEDNHKECFINQVASDFPVIARVLCGEHVIPEEVLKALFLFDWQKHHALQSESEEDADGQEEAGNQFMDQCAAYLAHFSLFVDTVPIKSLTCLVLDNSQFVPRTFSGGEDWFAIYKEEWKRLFDLRWNQWVHDYKKEQLKAKLNEYFGLSNYPLFPFRPWEKIWSGSFRYELSLGFLNYTFKEFFLKYRGFLKIISLEAEFVVKENRGEFTDLVAAFNKINDDLDVLANQLSAAGEWGMDFIRYASLDEPAESDEIHIKNIMAELERTAFNCITEFGKASRPMQQILDAMTGERSTSLYGRVSNIHSIQGSKNKAFIANLQSFRLGIRRSYEMVSELESIDIPSAV